MLDLDEELRDAGARWRAGQRDPIVDVQRATAWSGIVSHQDRDGGRVRRTRCRRGNSFSSRSRPDPSGRRRADAASEWTRSDPAESRDPRALGARGRRRPVVGLRLRCPSGNVHRAPAHLQEIDAKTGKLVGDVTLPDDSPYEIRVAGDVVWVAAEQADESTELLKIDAASMTILARIPGTISSQFTVTPDAVWGLDGAGSLRRIDPLTAQVVASIPLRVFGIYADGFVVSGPLGVFVGNGSSGRVQKIDEATNTAGPEIDVAPQLSGMVELGDSLWVRDGDRVVELADGTTPGARVPLGERVFDIATRRRVALARRRRRARVALRSRYPLGDERRPASGHARPHPRRRSEDGRGLAMSQEPTPRLLRVPTG